ncbi:alpha/beta-type small acid-soluble spore protein [Desulfolucanica intricata]|uniref:alpha/beta-type small acid-soluble spore protein n=1 Tax=Desulfolucanica intricata TaxID=1285191 RepID=UPI000832A0B3|nr:alpha/beta-type small acid-soluble spore protein [Desulfolucanica intricata]
MPRNRNNPVTPGAKSALNNLKFEVANELGIADYTNIDKGSLPSRVNGYVGGNMTKKLVAFAEQALQNGATPQVAQSAQLETPTQQGQGQ